MALSNDINELNKQIKELAQQLGKGLKIFEEREVEEAKIYLQGLQTEANKLNSELNAVVGIFQSINSELTKGRSTFNQINSSSRKLENIAAQILYRRENITKISAKELKQLQDKSKIEFANLARQKAALRLTGKHNDLTTKEGKAYREISGILEKNVGLQASFNRQLESALKEQTAIENSLGLTGAILKTITNIPGLSSLSQYFNINEALESVEEYNKKLIDNVKISKEFASKFKRVDNLIDDSSSNIEDINEKLKDQNLTATQRNNLEKLRLKETQKLNKAVAKRSELEAEATKKALRGINKLKSAFVGLQSLAKGFYKSITDPATIMATIGKSFLEFNKANREFRQVTGQTATNFNSIDDSIVSFTDQVKTITALSKELGINVNAAFNKDTILAATELTELLGLSSTEAANLALRAEALGQNLSDVDDDTFSVVKNFNSTNRRAVNVQDVLKDTANASGMLATSLGKNPKALQEAAAAARGLGLSLKEVEGIADSLLNFQSSIEAELEAELLTGQQINLERARSAALMNDMETLSDEIGKNEAVINAFASGNRIQQQAIAKAMGISTDQMAKMYFQQKLNAGLTIEQAAKAADISVEEAKRLAVQEQITKSVEKLSAAFAPILEMVASLVDNFVGMSIVIGGIVTMMGVSFIKNLAIALPFLNQMLVKVKAIKLQSLGSAIANAYKAAMNSPQAFVTGGIAGAIMGAALTAIIMSAVNRASKKDDFLLPAVGGSGYGKRMISAPEGTFALNDKDTIIAGTDLGRSESTSSPQNSPSANINLAETNALLKQLISAVKASGNTIIEIDGNKLGKVVKQNEVSMG